MVLFADKDERGICVSITLSGPQFFIGSQPHHERDDPKEHIGKVPVMWEFEMDPSGGIYLSNHPVGVRRVLHRRPRPSVGCDHLYELW